MSALPKIITDLSARLLPLETDAAYPKDAGRRAAVLILLFPRGCAIHFPLTVRPETLTRHAGQIALPGGVVEPGDLTPWDAAVRETQEELGVDLAGISPLGRLATHHLTVSNYLISPFVAWLPHEPALSPDPGEVAEVFHVALPDLIDPALVERETWPLRGRRWTVTFYRFGGRVVWGATARILYELACRLQDRPLDQIQGPGSVIPTE